MKQLTISRLNTEVYRVLDAQCNHVGNLKFIQGVWKFKAIGYDAQGDVIPGGGPLTHKHNITFPELDAAQISTRLDTTNRER